MSDPPCARFSCLILFTADLCPLLWRETARAVACAVLAADSTWAWVCACCVSVLCSFLAVGCVCSAAVAGRHATGLSVHRRDLCHNMDERVSPRVQKILI